MRETRVTGIISHVMIGLSMLMLPYPLAYIPRPVLDGLFIYVAITALYGNQLFDRILLFFTEQVSPLNGYNYDHYTCIDYYGTWHFYITAYISPRSLYISAKETLGQ